MRGVDGVSAKRAILKKYFSRIVSWCPVFWRASFHQMRRTLNRCEIAKCYSYVTAIFGFAKLSESKKAAVYAAFLVELTGFEPVTF